MHDVCENENNIKTKQKKITRVLLQERQVEELQGYSCKIIKTTFLLYCGAWSHTKMAQMPKIEINQMLSVRECESLINTGKFITLEGTTHQVSINREEVFSVTEKGIIHDAGNSVSCQGETMKIGRELVDNILQMSQYKISIQEEKLLIKGPQVEVLSDHTKLPCQTHKRGCVTATKTYYWMDEVKTCSLEKIRTIEIDTEKDLIVDHTHKIIFNQTGMTKSPMGCPITDLITTEYSNLFLTKSKEFEQGVDVLDIQNYINNRDNYITYTMEEKMVKILHKTKASICKIQYTTDEIMRIDEHHFAKIQGDAVMVFSCTEKKAKIETLDTCRADIPLSTGKFVKPQTRVMIHTSPRIECNQHFPMVIQSEEGWIGITPSLIPVSPPLKKDFILDEFQHESLAHGGIYTEQEVKAWESLIEYSNFHTALTRTLSYGVCLHEGECENDQIHPIPSYNLDRLIDPLKQQLSVLSKIDTYLNQYSLYISILVLSGWIIKVVIWVASFTAIVLQEGMNGAIALCFSTICFPVHQMRKISKRAKQRRRKIPMPDYEESVPMDPYQQAASF